ncbi:hypothetical protein JJL45_11855 [Tamlana sp. s12]|uniref:hypothetical protein n=1 Tax=Tamlana sp. s12 TaxID=1630406 RepID=UPI0007FE871C|nr:hypothetical protein [Tamlana sp. s12]OBQ46587.1 hypothetical protein VQ01_15555 [Tamlana sp. s12]QQY81616.1 hypothetical protein JJL45_11855 [Tamlana sp. s12]
MNEDLLNELTEMDEIHCVLSLQKEAENYLKSFDWCLKIKKSWYDSGFSSYDIIGVFLFEIEPINENVDDFIWVIVGDLPTVYLDKTVTSGMEAIEVYCDLMEDWIDNVKKGQSLEECFPVPSEPTIENADLLKTRIELIKEIFLTE